MKIPLFFVNVDIEIKYHPRSRKEWMYFIGTLVSLVLCCFIAYYTIIYLQTKTAIQKIEEKEVKMQPEKQERKKFTLDEALDIIRDRFTQ